MANIYVRSTDGLDTDTGATWALAKATLSGAAAIDAAGDTIYVSQVHAESSAAAQTIALAGTASNPVRVICGNDAAEPPTSVASSATVTTTLGNAITITGSGYLYGLTFNCGSGNNIASLNIATADQDAQIYDTCILNLANTSGSSGITLGSGTAATESSLTFINSQFKFGTTTRTIAARKTPVIIRGGSIASGSAAITTFIFAAQDNISYKITGFDFSNAAATFNVLYASSPATGRIDLINCKLPASWTGGIVAGAPLNPGFRASMYNCDSTNTNYRLWIETFSGSIKSETTIVKTGGASDGTTALSWKMTTAANANETFPLVSDDIAVWIDTTGASKTLTIDVVHDSLVALTDAEVWVEIDYLDSSTHPISTLLSDHRVTILTAAANQTASTATWTTTGLINPNKQKLEVTFTNQMKGFVYARVCLAKPSYPLYVDYSPVLS